jgi:hypothetical protein
MAIFGNMQDSPDLPTFAKPFNRGLTRLADICQAVYPVHARLADIRQTVLRGLARLTKGEFGECYANLANLANVW